MAAVSEATSSLVEAYIGHSLAPPDIAPRLQAPLLGWNAAALGGMRPRPQRATELCTVRCGHPLNRIRCPEDAKPTLPRSARPPRRSQEVSQRPCTSRALLLGSWAPETKLPKRAASSDGAAVKSLGTKELESSIRIMTQCLQDSGAPLPDSVSLARRRRRGIWRGNAIDDMDSLGDSSCDGSHCMVTDCQTQLSHATTPSWRSRSFPPHLAKSYPETITSGQNETYLGSRRLPALPDEARLMTQCSEVQRLRDISAEVHEANALLVESYLNVKRRPINSSGPISSCGPSAASGTASGSFVERWSGDQDEISASLTSARPPRLPRKHEHELGPLFEGAETCSS